MIIIIVILALILIAICPEIIYVVIILGIVALACALILTGTTAGVLAVNDLKGKEGEKDKKGDENLTAIKNLSLLKDPKESAASETTETPENIDEDKKE